MTNSKNSTAKQITRLRKSIELQTRIKENLEGMSIAAPESIELCGKIIAQLQAQLSIYEMRVDEDRRLYKVIFGKTARVI